MNAELMQKFGQVFDDGSRIEAIVWRVPSPVPPSSHGYKYRLVYLVDEVRVIGFDNERGKGDHKHVGGVETAYTFTSVEQLLDDFIEEIEKWNAR